MYQSPQISSGLPRLTVSPTLIGRDPFVWIRNADLRLDTMYRVDDGANFHRHKDEDGGNNSYQINHHESIP